MISRKAQLIRQLRSGNFTTMTRALEELRNRGWLTDGSMTGASLSEANLNGMNLTGISLQRADLFMADLSHANLTEADLSHADLSGALLLSADLTNAELHLARMEGTDLTGATINEKQLASLMMLVNATMPDGSLYDGRYNLPGDRQAGLKDLPETTPETWAEWYGVTVGRYEAGQEWAEQHLKELRTELRATPVKSRHDVKVESLITAIREADTNEEALDHLETARSRGWLRKGKFQAANFDGATLSDGYFKGANLRGATFNNADLAEADFSDADLRGCTFVGATLTQANFLFAKLQGVNLSGTDFSQLIIETQYIDLHEATLSGCNLADDDFEDADLSETDLTGANLTNANLFNVILNHADLTGTQVTEGQLMAAFSLTGLTMPDGSRYDGRYRLQGDLDTAMQSGFDPDIPEQAAHWYDVDLKQYEEGQRWADRNLTNE